MREVCATRKACPCHEGKKVSQHTLAQYKVCECSSQRTSQKKPLRALRGGWGTAKTHCQRTFLSHCLSAYPSACLSQTVGGLFRLKRRLSPHPPVWLHPHLSLIQFALICREPHLSLRARGGGGMGRGGGGEPAHCLCMNQGHWKIKADCGEIITDCSCGIILMRLGLTKPCLLYTMASLWDDYC